MAEPDVAKASQRAERQMLICGLNACASVGVFGNLHGRGQSISLQKAPMPEPIVLIVSPDGLVRQSLKALVESAGLRAAAFPTLQALLEAEAPQSRACLVFQPENNTLDDPGEQKRLIAACASQPGIVIIERGNVSKAVQALKSGIGDVVQKPYRDKELLEHIETVLEVNAHS
jgi:FixJ family two-component response regulator